MIPGAFNLPQSELLASSVLSHATALAAHDTNTPKILQDGFELGAQVLVCLSGLTFSHGVISKRLASSKWVLVTFDNSTTQWVTSHELVLDKQPTASGLEGTEVTATKEPKGELASAASNGLLVHHQRAPRYRAAPSVSKARTRPQHSPTRKQGAENWLQKLQTPIYQPGSPRASILSLSPMPWREMRRASSSTPPRCLARPSSAPSIVRPSLPSAQRSVSLTSAQRSVSRSVVLANRLRPVLQRHPAGEQRSRRYAPPPRPRGVIRRLASTATEATAIRTRAVEAAQNELLFGRTRGEVEEMMRERHMRQRITKRAPVLMVCVMVCPVPCAPRGPECIRHGWPCTCSHSLQVHHGRCRRIGSPQLIGVSALLGRRGDRSDTQRDQFAHASGRRGR